MSSTPRLALPFLSVGQAQKEIFHNEALQTLDTAVAAAAIEAPRNDPPAAPGEGACYLVGTMPTGAWLGKAQCVAAFSGGGWRFVTPPEGMRVYVVADGVWATFREGAWEVGPVRGSSLILEGQQVVGERLPAISAPTGGINVDSEARDVLNQVLSAMRGHGLIEM